MFPGVKIYKNGEFKVCIIGGRIWVRLMDLDPLPRFNAALCGHCVIIFWSTEWFRFRVAHYEKKTDSSCQKAFKKVERQGDEKKDKINFIPVRNLLCDPFRDGGRL